MTQTYNKKLEANNKSFLKSPFVSMIKWNVKDNIPRMIMFSLILLVVYFIEFFSSGSYGFEWEDSNVFIFGLMVTIVLTFFYSITVCLDMCSYLHSKRQCDSYMSMPLPKPILFLSQYVSGLKLILIPVIVASFIGINTFTLLSELEYSYTQLLLDTCTYLLYLIPIITLMYTFNMFIGLLCGKKSTYIASIIGLNLLILIVCGIFDILNITFVLGIDGFINQPSYFINSLVDNQFMYFVTLLLAPAANVLISVVLGANNGINYDDLGNTTIESGYFGNLLITIDGLTVLYNLLAIGVLLAVAYFVAKKRNSQFAAKPFAFRLIPIIFKCMVTATFAFIILYSIIRLFNIDNIAGQNQINPILIFVMSIIILIASSVGIYILATVISTKNNAKLKKYKIECIACALLVVSVFTIFSTGLFGTDTYMPDVEEVDYVEVSYRISESSNGYQYYDVVLSQQYSEKSQIEDIQKLHNTILKAVRDEGFYPYTFKDNDFSKSVEFVYYCDDVEVSRVYSYEDIENSNIDENTKAEIFKELDNIEKVNEDIEIGEII